MVGAEPGENMVGAEPGEYMVAECLQWGCHPKMACVQSGRQARCRGIGKGPLNAVECIAIFMICLCGDRACIL